VDDLPVFAIASNRVGRYEKSIDRDTLTPIKFEPPRDLFPRIPAAIEREIKLQAGTPSSDRPASVSLREWLLRDKLQRELASLLE